MKRKKSNAQLTIMLKTLLRRKTGSIILVAVMLIATLACIILHGLQARQVAAIADMQDNTQIRCTVTNAQGSGLDQLEVGSFFVDMLTGLRHSRDCYLDEYVKDVYATAWEKLSWPAGAELHRIYTVDSDPSLQAINGGGVEFYAGWSAECLQESKPVCLVTPDLLAEAQSDSSGKTFVTVVRENGNETDLEVIGTVTGAISSRVYCPFYANLHEGESEAFPMASCSFTIRDNHILQESKQALYEYFDHPSPSQTNTFTTAGLLVHDEIYLQSLKELQDNLVMLRVVLPVLILITGCVGFLSSYLSNRRRKKELAVMRCIGIKRRGVFWQVFLEQGLLAVCGCGVGLLLGLLLGEALSSGALGLIAILLGIDLLGAAVAALQISSVNVMELMKVEE